MPEIWNRFEGLTVAGKYRLTNCLGGTTRTAWYRAEPPAVVRLAGGGNREADALVARWERVQALAAPELITIAEAGRTELEGAPAVYAVMELPDEMLAEVVRGQRLSEDQVRQVLLASAGALAALHSRGMVHGQVAVESVVAVGDAVKLSSDEIRETTPLAPAEDVRALGRMACELLGEEVPEGFREFVALCRRGEPAERLLRCLRGEPEPRPAPVAVPLPPPPPARPAPEPRRGLPKWAYALAPVPVLLAVWAFRGIDSSPAPAPAPAPVRAAVQPAPPPPLPPPAATPVPAVTGKWRVVAYTYSSRGHAEKKAATINSRHPGMHAQVYAPRGERAPFFVALGGRMSREEAVRLQRQARAKGLPRDTFVRNFAD